MAGEIFIADKKTLDSVKQDTEYLRNKPGGSFLDANFSSIDEFKIFYTYASDLSKFFKENGDEPTLIDVRGKGYVNNLWFNNKDNYNHPCKVHVLLTVDDIQYKFAAYDRGDYELRAGEVLGIHKQSSVSPYESLDSTNIYEILSTSNIIRNLGFKFNKSCKIQLKKMGTVSDLIHLSVSGGVLIE